MIGLGSNRLTVCRRGGMSVTQAGRGGMEWLGVRDPSLATPYSAQATAALKAQFPTQWLTIRDYGFAHPALVEYVNAHPIGWGRFIAYYQECEYIQCTGTQWIQTQIAGGVHDITMDVIVTGHTTSDGYSVPWFGQSLDSYSMGYFYYGGYYYYTGPGGYYSKHFSQDELLSLRIIEDGNKAYLYSNGVLIYENNHSITDGGTVVLMRSYNNNPSRKVYSRLKQKTIIGTCAGADVYVIPCYHKTNGTIGMYDVVNDKFYENSGTGTFGKGADVN